MDDNVSEPEITWRIEFWCANCATPCWMPFRDCRWIGDEEEAREKYEVAKANNDRVRLVRVEETTVEID